MNLIDYVNLLATRICNISTEITVLQNSIDSLNDRVTVLETTVADLSNYTTPEFSIDCNIGTLTTPNTYPINEILEEFINVVWCPMNTALVGPAGSAGSLTSAIASQCTLGTDTALLNQFSSPTTMSVEYAGSWVAAPVSVADTIKNL